MLDCTRMIGNVAHSAAGRMAAGHGAPAPRASPYSAVAPTTRNGHWPAFTSGPMPVAMSHVSHRSPLAGKYVAASSPNGVGTSASDPERIHRTAKCK